MKLSFALAAVAACYAGVAFAEDVAPADVQYTDEGAIAASLSGAAGDAANGKKVMSTKSKGNCVACHAISAMADVPFHGEVGPTLDGVATRWDEAHLRGIVANAKKTYEGTIMPAFYKNDGYIRPGDAYTGKAPTEALTPLLTAQEVEDVVAYLMTLKD
ncbi:sulfur oxidation c-type cytochrome SoxX [Donghicola sp. C2-DW-16]|uniref:Sulfur oxidation c-type cytochrome SoxX n=1 Tax=Donghicola mangrovi TaxID=2729614 RepID=A0A850Q137_9RHOB|nr:sulfur oxidation c-type cytochrome SoxX [Donghicola mangrovi]NVO22733.1 sulfur oxidation c-type cytochrome SoxX [Donghicola mangrovi]NVO27679.1 sulfur oxidation c-type cytochrome SoxX [Donghicola mangrovi]